MHSVTKIYVLLLFCVSASLSGNSHAESVSISLSSNPSPRVQYGAEQLQHALTAVGLEITNSAKAGSPQIALKLSTKDDIANPEGFHLLTTDTGQIEVLGGGDSGLLYGCLELAKLIGTTNKLPDQLDFRDAPVFKLRGPCFGMQKTRILPGRKVYEYPYTPELFPFFYDKEYWQDYLDFLVANRMNTLYIWNGHPFASLVKLPDYPYALEVSPEVFEKNVEMFRYITKECDKRGIWLVQMFYNIIVSQPFAEHHGIATQMDNIDPIVADYTRKSIAEFVRQYPNVGLMVCLGEACVTLDNQVQWCTEVILPGVKDGMKAAGLTDEPPVVIRAHATDATVVMPKALEVYDNLYTEAKFNGESLTTWQPRGAWQEIHQKLSRLGSTHVSNIHILANLEPFRYGAQRFIQKSVQASRDRLGAEGLHVYPLAYWNWPDAPDKTAPPLEQIERDWIWFEAWARYAWNPDVDPDKDHKYWVDRLAAKYGSREAAEHILTAYNDSGECAPLLLRRFGITEGNRQTLALGMTLDQLINPEKYRPYPELWLSQAPPGERLDEYMKRKFADVPHEGETPISILEDTLRFSQNAVVALEAATPHVKSNQAEFQRLKNDVACIRAMVQNYAAKVQAAMLVMEFQHSQDASLLTAAEQKLAESLEHFHELTALTQDTYEFANSMQTDTRRIPVTGAIGTEPVSFHWTQLLEVYEKELAEFRNAVSAVKTGDTNALFRREKKPLRKAAVKVLSSHAEAYTVQTGTRAFNDQQWRIQALVPELDQLTGIRFPHASAAAGKYEAVEFEVEEPVLVLIGYIRSEEKQWLQPPRLEMDALGGERGGTEVYIQDAAMVDTLPPIDVYALRFDKGTHKLTMRGQGSFTVLGIAVEEQPLSPGMAVPGSQKAQP
jgi:hypothetical protein